MIKGWRNDPRWVAHYNKRDAERRERAIERAKRDLMRVVKMIDLDRLFRDRL